MSSDSEIFNLSKLHWLSNEVNFNEKLILKIYNDQILRFGFSHRQIQNLEFTQYFEKYLWPNFSINQYKCERQYIISICAIINEKLSEKVNPWESIQLKPENFADLFQKVLELIIELSIDLSTEKLDQKYWLEQIVLLQFINNCFLNMTEIDLIFNEIKYLMSLGMWTLLSERRLNEELSKNKEYKHKYGKLIKSNDKSEDHIKFKRTFLPKLLDTFLKVVENENEIKDILSLRYAENCVLLFINLESMLVSRRYLNSVIDDKHVIVRAQNCILIQHFEDNRLLIQLIDMLDLYAHFEIDEASGSTLTDSQLECRHREKLTQLQREAFIRFKEPMCDLWLSTCRTLEDGVTFRNMLESQTIEDLSNLATTLGLITEQESLGHTKEHLIDMFCYSFKKRTSTLDRLNNLPLYPTERLIYDDNQIPEGHFSVEDNFAIPKLSVQYLSFHDYLMRNFELFRLEASYEIKQDIEQCLAMMKPIVNEKDEVIFQGWSRMALAIDNFEIVDVAKPEIGRNFPKVVKADVTVILGNKDIVKAEWENLTKHDPCFLITVYPKLTYDQRYNNKESMASQMNNMIIRGCEIEGMLDKDGKVIAEEDKRTKTQTFPGKARTWRVKLDPCQYHNDVINDESETKDVYGTFNIFLRRKPKENNFKAVLETIRDLMNDQCVVPSFLQDLLLGYDQPNAAHYSVMASSYIQKQNWVDTFLSLDHLRQCFPQYQIKSSDENLSPPFKLTFPSPMEDKSLVPIQMHDINNAIIPKESRPLLVVEAHKPLLKLAQKFTDPRRWNQFLTLPKKALIVPGNLIPFTATQVEAIRSGMQHGLTLVVGPPGTGKTDIAVQIISNIYRNYPNQRTLIVTHSNQALNQLFEKIMNLEIDERHLLRLGHGEEALETTKDFSKYGRVNYVLAKRLQLLREVERLSLSLDCINIEYNESDQSLYTCETSQHFLLSEVMPRWLTFTSDFSDSNAEYTEDCNYNSFITSFPFINFFIPKEFQNEMSIKELFNGNSLQEDLNVARACFRHILDMFIQLDDFRSFELMRNGLSRANSLLVQHTKIIAMTCTHAALRRRDLIQLGFTYDNILIEEAAQILEIETFIPLLLQKPDQSNLNRLKRWVMIGDHNQLPPVIKNMVFQNYCNMSQSMFARLVKLGVPAIQLNAQGRSRHDIVSLYSWRYKSLDDLPTIKHGPEYSVANPGLLYDYQLINVPDYLGQGESEPTPHFIQNLAEAEYCVALYMYMRAIGYHPEKITILTTYNGQKHLIRDVIKNRCSEMGPPSKITTVDRFQGQQNDYIILSLVRTKTVGHLRDIRRLVVALSRARLGLYVFCRTAMFTQCKELQKSFGLLMQRRTDLALVTGEHYSFVENFLKGNNIKVRMANQSPISSSVTFMQDVQHMTQYVHTIYNSFKNRLLAKKRLFVEEKVSVGTSSLGKRQKLQKELNIQSIIGVDIDHEDEHNTMDIIEEDFEGKMIDVEEDVNHERNIEEIGVGEIQMDENNKMDTIEKEIGEEQVRNTIVSTKNAEENVVEENQEKESNVQIYNDNQDNVAELKEIQTIVSYEDNEAREVGVEMVADVVNEVIEENVHHDEDDSIVKETL